VRPGAPTYVTRAHLYGANASLAASLGPGAAAMKPSRAEHNIRAVLETTLGITVFLQAPLQINFGFKPSSIFTPTLWSGGGVGPNGQAVLPAYWFVAVVHPTGLSAAYLVRIWESLVVDPRFIAGLMNLSGGLVCAYSIWALYAGQRSEHTVSSRAGKGGSEFAVEVPAGEEDMAGAFHNQIAPAGFMEADDGCGIGGGKAE
jgi:hypothetical protein